MRKNNKWNTVNSPQGLAGKGTGQDDRGTRRVKGCNLVLS